MPEAITGAGAVDTDGGCGWGRIKLEEHYGVDFLQLLHSCKMVSPAPASRMSCATRHVREVAARHVPPSSPWPWMSLAYTALMVNRHCALFWPMKCGFPNMLKCWGGGKGAAHGFTSSTVAWSVPLRCSCSTHKKRMSWVHTCAAAVWSCVTPSTTEIHTAGAGAGSREQASGAGAA